MTFDPKVKDDDILSGFASLHQAMTEGFDRIERRFDRQTIDVRKEITQLEMRMLRKFDQVEERFDGLDAWFDRLEGRYDGLEIRVSRIEERDP